MATSSFLLLNYERILLFFESLRTAYVSSFLSTVIILFSFFSLSLSMTSPSSATCSFNQLNRSKHNKGNKRSPYKVCTGSVRCGSPSGQLHGYGVNTKASPLFSARRPHVRTCGVNAMQVHMWLDRWDCAIDKNCNDLWRTTHWRLRTEKKGGEKLKEDATAEKKETSLP